MTAGLPGTGIGGLFYLLLVFWMPCRELYLLCRGRSSLRRWRAIAFFLGLTVAIIATTWFEAWAISQAVVAAAQKFHLQVPGQNGTYRLLAATSILMSLGSLVTVLLAVHALRWIVRLTGKPNTKPAKEATIRTFPDLFPEPPLQPAKGFQAQLDRPGRAA